MKPEISNLNSSGVGYKRGQALVSKTSTSSSRAPSLEGFVTAPVHAGADQFSSRASKHHPERILGIAESLTCRQKAQFGADLYSSSSPDSAPSVQEFIYTPQQRLARHKKA